MASKKANVKPSAPTDQQSADALRDAAVARTTPSVSPNPDNRPADAAAASAAAAQAVASPQHTPSNDEAVAVSRAAAPSYSDGSSDLAQALIDSLPGLFG